MTNKAQAVAPKARSGSVTPWGERVQQIDRNITALVASHGLDRSSDAAERDLPITDGLRILVLAGDGSRRLDLVGLTGIVRTKLVQKSGAIYTFELETGELINSHHIWWQRIPEFVHVIQ